MKKVAIFGTPRSGTSWLGHIFNSHPDVALRFQPLFSYGHKGALTPESTSSEIRRFFEQILHSEDAFTLMKADVQRDYPRFEKSGKATHLVFKETRYLHVVGNVLARCEDVKVVGIVRNPLAVLASWMSAPMEFDPAWDIRKEWRDAPGKNEGRPEEFFGFNRWKESTEAFLRLQGQFPRQFFLVRYDELNARPVETTRRLFDFCELDMSDQVHEFLRASKSRHDPDPYSVFRARASDDAWRGVLPDDIARQVVSELSSGPLGAFVQAPANGVASRQDT